MTSSVLPGIESPPLQGWPAPVATWQHTGQAGQFQVRVDLIRGTGRKNAVPKIELGYETGGVNGIFGKGWSLNLPAVIRGNGRQLPQYRDNGPASDPYSSTEFGELVPLLSRPIANWQPETLNLDGFDIARFRPRSESAFSRIESWTNLATGEIHWETISRNNVRRIFGRSPQGRIADPSDPLRIARWLIEEERDSFGNILQFEYKREDLSGVPVDSLAEQHRLAGVHSEAVVHPKRIKWGNIRPGQASDWLFELVFDFGEHERDHPTPEEVYPWALRPDPFSNYRSGFELRTRRICQRILLFHHIEGVALLARAHELSYQSTPANSLLNDITTRCYRQAADGSITANPLPTVHFDYSETLSTGPTRQMRSTDAEVILSSTALGQQWLDIDNNGLPDLVYRETGGAIFYRPNLGLGILGAPTSLPNQPAIMETSMSSVQTIGKPFGDGRSCVIDLSNGPGYQERLKSGAWQPYQPFPESPSVRTSRAGTRNLDLDGDGCADLMHTGAQGAQWYQFDKRNGWARSQETGTAPNLQAALADRTGTVFLADMSGDGLADLVQVRPGNVKYWPNLGYGRFGEPVQMANSPWLDGPGLFDPARVRLFDIDGTGAADLVYLGRETIHWYGNYSGNGFGPQQAVENLPFVGSLDGIDVVDLLGTGTGCLVWSSLHPGHADRPLQFVELVGGQRPDLLTRIQNGAGAEVEIAYSTSTQLLLDDQAAGIPWLSILPAPVWVVTELRESDLISGIGRVTSWRYRHGYYDDVARESRGFAFVRRREMDVIPGDPIDRGLDVSAPMRETRTWYHTGVYLDREQFETGLAAEFFNDGTAASNRPGLAVENDAEIAPRELLRALQGKPEREEVYGYPLDETSAYPYKVTDYGYVLRALQPAWEQNPPAVAIFEGELVSRSYEGERDDPRTIQRVSLEVDAWGSATRQMTLAYPRHHASEPEQSRFIVTLEEYQFSNQVAQQDWYRVGTPCARRSYEVGPIPTQPLGILFAPLQIQAWFSDPVAVDLPFESALPSAGPPQRLLLAAEETYYWDGELSGFSEVGAAGSRALLHHQRQAALTNGLLVDVYGAGTVTPADLNAIGYEFDHNLWWARGSSFSYDPVSFFQPVRETISSGGEYSVNYDPYKLFVIESRDPQDNLQQAQYDYQSLSASSITDANDATLQIAFDNYGFPEKTAFIGAHGEGDSLIAPTSQITRDVLAWQRERQPGFLHTSARVRHADPASPQEMAVVFHDGFSREIQQKRLAELAADGSVRWVVEKDVVANLAGTPLRVYSPGFTSDEHFSPEASISAFPITRSHLDALGRTIAGRRPDGALAKTVRTPWLVGNWDENDSVLESEWLRLRLQPGATAQQGVEAGAAQSHANTPATEHLDPMGRTFLHVEDAGPQGLAATRTALSASGKVLTVTDPRMLLAEQRMYDMLGQVLSIRSTASGNTSALYDSQGNPVHNWGARGQEQRLIYDRSARLQRRDIRSPAGGWRVSAYVVWGESNPDAGAYARGRPYLSYDDGGQQKIVAYDFHGNPLRKERMFCADLTTPADWSRFDGVVHADEIERLARAQLNEQVFSTTNAFDALDRVVSRSTFDGSVSSSTTIDYGPRGLPENISIDFDGETKLAYHSPVYDAAGRKQSAIFGNEVRETSVYDDLTGYLTGQTTRAPDGSVLRGLGLSFDAVGNILRVTDMGQQILYFRNAEIVPDRIYSYDSLYRLVSAQGREAAEPPPAPDGWSEPIAQSIPHPNDSRAVRRYTEAYSYDLSGNLIQLEHAAPPDGNWAVGYDIHPATDRITGVRARDGAPISTAFGYNEAGSSTILGGLSGLVWNDDEQLAQVDLGGGGRAYYVYDASGQRIAKTIVRLGGAREQRLYLGGFERFRRTTALGALDEETSSLHLESAEGRLLLVEKRQARDGGGATLWRYQHMDQVGSSWLETDQNAQILTFEEFRPFGGTAYHAGGLASLPKRFRFGGQENDRETGLNYHGRRYYAPWFSRWISPDPAGMADGTNRYWFVRDNPITWADSTGTQSQPVDAAQQWQESRGGWGSPEYNAYLAERFPAPNQEVVTMPDEILPRIRRPASQQHHAMHQRNQHRADNPSPTIPVTSATDVASTDAATTPSSPANPVTSVTDATSTNAITTTPSPPTIPAAPTPVESNSPASTVNELHRQTDPDPTGLHATQFIAGLGIGGTAAWFPFLGTMALDVERSRHREEPRAFSAGIALGQTTMGIAQFLTGLAMIGGGGAGGAAALIAAPESLGASALALPVMSTAVAAGWASMTAGTGNLIRGLPALIHAMSSDSEDESTTTPQTREVPNESNSNNISDSPAARGASADSTQESVTPPDNVEFQGLVDDVADFLEAEPDRVGEVLRVGERNQMLQDPRRWAPVRYGNSIERWTGRIGQLRGLLVHTGDTILRNPLGRYLPRIDFEGIGRWQGQSFEITTEREWESHYVREYGPRVIFARYKMPRSFLRWLARFGWSY